MATHSVNLDSILNAKSATLSRGHHYILSFLLLSKYLATHKRLPLTLPPGPRKRSALQLKRVFRVAVACGPHLTLGAATE